MTIFKHIPGTKTGRIGLWAASIAGAIGLTAALVACGGGSDFGTATNPTAPSYTVSGMVTNLQVTGLSVLLSAAGSTASFAVPPNQNTFTFTTSLPTSTTYSAVITQQPLGFTQQCALSNGSGTIAQANVNNVAIACHTATAVVSTLAGTTTRGFANGVGASASFYKPHGVAVDANGNVYVGDTFNYAIRKITAAGLVSTLAGGTSDYVDGTSTIAKFQKPNQVAVDASGNVYFADPVNNAIRKITPAGQVSTIGGSAGFSYPLGVAADGSVNVYVSDNGNCLIRMITPAGVVSTLAGGGGTNCGFVDGTGTVAQFSQPYGIAVDSSGNVYVADYGNNVVRKITAQGVVTTLAGGGSVGGNQWGYQDGTGVAALFSYNLHSVAVDGAGYVDVADSSNNLVRKITPLGVVTTLAGGGVPGGTQSGSSNGVGTAATFNYLWRVAVDAAGNLYVGDTYNNMIRKVTPK